MSTSYQFKFGGVEISIHQSWSPLFLLMREELEIISSKIGDASLHTPARENIFKVFKNHLKKLRLFFLDRIPILKKMLLLDVLLNLQIIKIGALKPRIPL